MRIAHVVAPSAFGGLESVVAGLARAHRVRGHEVLVLALLDDEDDSPTWLSELASADVRLEISRVPRRAYLRERRQALQVLARYDIEIVHTHGFRPDVVVGAAVGRVGRVAVSTVHGFVRKGVRGHVYAWIQLRALRGFDRVVAVSRDLEVLLKASGIPHATVRCIANGAVTDGAPLSRADARQSLGLPAQGLIIGWVGRVSAEKGPDLLIQAFALIDDPSVTLCVVGDGSEREPTQALADRAGIGSMVVFAGARRGAALLLDAFDLLVLSSRTEGTPMILLEAGTAGVPVVATPVGGVPDALGEDGGWLTESTDPTAIAKAIDAALAQPAERARRAGVLRERIRTRDREENWVDRYDALYVDALAARRPSAARHATP